MYIKVKKHIFVLLYWHLTNKKSDWTNLPYIYWLLTMFQWLENSKYILEEIARNINFLVCRKGKNALLKLLLDLE